MKKLIQVAALSAFTFSATNALAAVTESFDAKLLVRQAISLINERPLDFGVVTTSDTTDITVEKGAGNAAQFTITGEKNAVVDVTINDAKMLNAADPTKGINVVFTDKFDKAPTLDNGGKFVLNVGGIAKIADASVAGDFVTGNYKAAVPVEVEYQ